MSNSASSFLFAVIPTLALAGPMAILAALCPAVVALLALFWRRWWVFLAAVSINSTVYLAHAWFRGYADGAWWGTARALLILFAFVAFAGTVYSYWRFRQGTPTPTTPRFDLAMFMSATVLGLGAMVFALFEGVLLREPWREALPLLGAVAVGTVFLLLRITQAEAAILAAMAVGNVVIAGFAGPLAPAEILWTFEAVDRGVIYSAPCVTDQHIYVSAAHTGLKPSGAVYCLDRRTGKALWTFNRGGDMKQALSSPVLHAGKLYVGEGLHEDADCRLYCLDAGDGHEVWSFATGSHVESTPCVADGRVYFGAGDDGVYCLNASDGSLRWRFPGVHVDSTPALADGRLYVGSGHGKSQMLCLDARTGKPIWQVPSDLSVFGSPTIDRNRIYFGIGNAKLTRSAAAAAGALVCLKAADGTPLWRRDVADAVLGAAVVDDDFVYFGARDGKCYCVKSDDGAIHWQRDLHSPVVASCVRRGTHLYVVATGGAVYCLKAADGSVRWNFDIAWHTRTTPEMVSRPGFSNDDDGPTLYLGAGLRYSVSSAAVVLALKSPLR